jgi:hypothetical protein
VITGPSSTPSTAPGDVFATTHWTVVLAASLLLLVLCSCTTAPSNGALAAKPPVRKVDYRRAPEMQELAARAQKLGNEMYPKVCALLLNDSARPPAQFDIVFERLAGGEAAATSILRKRIFINSAYFTNQATVDMAFDKTLVHELAHVATQTRHWSSFLFDRSTANDEYNWGESIANFAFYKLVDSTGKYFCPRCDLLFPHYQSGYACGGAFLLYLDANHGPNLVPQVVRAVRRREDLSRLLEKTTGKTLETHWTEFQQTPAFTPPARELWKLRVALGYTNAYQLRGLRKRFDQYVAQHADEFTQKAIKGMHWPANNHNETDFLLGFYVYLTQPGGPAERHIWDLGKQGQLPGLKKGEKGSLETDWSIPIRDFPNSRTVSVRVAGDSLHLYHYRISRGSPADSWKLVKAWRTTAGDDASEEIPIP